MALTLALVFISFLVFFQFLSLRNRKVSQFMGKFKGPLSLPLIGNVWCLASSTNRLSALLGLQKKYGNRVVLNMGLSKGLLLFHPDDVAKILGSHEVNKGKLYHLIFKDWLGSECILFAKGKEHLRQRKLFQPAFTYRLLSKFEGKFNEHAKKLVRIMNEDAEKGAATEIRWLLTRLAIDTIAEYLGGIKLNSLIMTENKFAAAFHTETKCIYQRALSPWLWPEFLWKASSIGRKEKTSREFLRSYIFKEIEEQKKLILSGQIDNFPKQGFPSGAKPTFQATTPLQYIIDKQLQEGSQITDDLLQQLGNAGIFAGHETVASSLIFTIFQLAANPTEQEKLHKELDEIFGQDLNRAVESVDLPKLVYLEACIKEALRLYPPAPIMPRELSKDLQLDDGTIIPKSVEINLSPWVTHRLAEFYPEPEKFLPSRFLPENSSKRHPYAFLAFSPGPRSCLGQKVAIVEEKIILSHIFRNFTVECVTPAESVIPMGEMVIVPKNPLYVRFKSR